MVFVLIGLFLLQLLPVPLSIWEGLAANGKTRTGSTIRTLSAFTRVCLVYGLSSGSFVTGLPVFSNGARLRVFEI